MMGENKSSVWNRVPSDSEDSGLESGEGGESEMEAISSEEHTTDGEEGTEAATTDGEEHTTDGEGSDGEDTNYGMANYEENVHPLLLNSLNISLVVESSPAYTNRR
jgi:hypothetical protein